MSYIGISVRDAMRKLNNQDGGWYLPSIQRQYVWGTRYNSEEFVCLLLDSLVKRYPIGGLVLWETRKPIPYREFLDDYVPNKFAKLVEEGRWGPTSSSFTMASNGFRRCVRSYGIPLAAAFFISTFCSTPQRRTQTRPDSCSATRTCRPIRDT